MSHTLPVWTFASRLSVGVQRVPITRKCSEQYEISFRYRSPRRLKAIACTTILEIFPTLTPHRSTLSQRTSIPRCAMIKALGPIFPSLHPAPISRELAQRLRVAELPSLRALLSLAAQKPSRQTALPPYHSVIQCTSAAYSKGSGGRLWQQSLLSLRRQRCSPPILGHLCLLPKSPHPHVQRRD